MTGVTILDTMEIYTLSWQQFVFGFTPMAIAAIISFVHIRIDYRKSTKHKPWEILYCVIGGILSLVLMLCLDRNCPADYVETRYKVTVDETTSFVEFHDKYNIVEEYPEYFIVIEKSE